MKACFRVILVFLAACLLPLPGRAPGYAQVITTPGGDNSFDVVEEDWLVGGKVKTLQGDPVPGATVAVEPAMGWGFCTLATNAQGEFRTDYRLNPHRVSEFSVILTVKKEGFQTAHAFVDYGNSAKTWEVPLTLRDAEEDATLLPAADLISGLAPALKQLGPADGLAAKSVKDYTRGVTEFFDQHHPERAVPLLAKVAGNNPACIGCRTMLGLTELGWGDWAGGSQALAQGVNATLENRKMGRPEALVAYGVWVSWQHDFDKAQPYFLEALKFAPQDALAFQELGRTLLAGKKFEPAADELKKGLDAGAGPEARLLYVEALLGADQSREAGAEMKRYLDGREVKNMPARVRQLWASVQDQEKVETLYAHTKLPKSQKSVDFLQRPPADLIQGLEPAQNQDQLASILDGAGAKILGMIENFPNTSSLEAIRQEKLGHQGGLDKQNQKFRYLCLAPHADWGPSFTEYRADIAGNTAEPKGLSEGFMLTAGFTSEALILHPEYRTESTFHYLGRQNVNGRDTFVVAFAQIPGKAHLTGKFQQGQNSLTTFSQGLVWIDTANCQIVRLHTDLLSPLPKLRLERESMDITLS